MSIRPAELLLASSVLASLLPGCGREPDALVTFFSDDLVEAPARNIALAVADSGCEVLLSVPHPTIATRVEVIFERQAPYPLDPSDHLLNGLPRGHPLSIDVAALDAQASVIARGCRVFELEPDAPTRVEVELRALPACDEAPRAIDLTVVLDTSSAMQAASLSLEDRGLDALAELLTSGLPRESAYSLVAHGHVPPAEVTSADETPDAASARIRGLEASFAGRAAHYDAIILAAARQRARAICGRRPALLAIAAGPDDGAPATLENAFIGINGARGDATDDIYTYGVAVTAEAKAALDALIPAELGEVRGASTRASYEGALQNARVQILGLVEP